MKITSYTYNSYCLFRPWTQNLAVTCTCTFCWEGHFVSLLAVNYIIIIIISYLNLLVKMFLCTWHWGNFCYFKLLCLGK